VRVTKDGELIDQARSYATRVVEADPRLAGHPDLAVDIARRLDEASADYLAKN
jgi:ATP-dependent DNA helicase RecG